MPSASIDTFLRKPTRHNRIFPHYDREADILSVSTHERVDWPYGVDIDGNIVFDLNKDKILVNFDLLIGRQRWKRMPLHWQWPAQAKEMDLGFSDTTICKKSFSLPIQVFTDQRTKNLTIQFDKSPDHGIAVRLSNACAAFLHKDRLLGFFIRLD